HLRVIFDRVQTMDSRGGLLRVREIIVRLGLESQHAPFPDRFVDSIFTIDDKGEIVGYALYSGLRVLELWRAVVQIHAGFLLVFPALPNVPPDKQPNGEESRDAQTHCRSRAR